MVKKNGVNIMLFVFITTQIFIISCAPGRGDESKGILMQTDREFSEMSQKEGMFRAFLEYIDEDGVILRDDSFPEKGRESLMKRFEGKSDTSLMLTWEPLYERMSQSGDLGYTYGIHTRLDKSTGEVAKGTYVTIWLKQSGGNWKFILDSGTQGLPLE
jgi:ketosteroid isomerase-like protein